MNSSSYVKALAAVFAFVLSGCPALTSPPAADTVAKGPEATNSATSPPATPSAKEDKMVIEEIFTATEGPAAKKGDKIAVHYTGTFLSDGKQFDSSVSRGQPIEIVLGVGQVIKGWDQGIVGMKVKGKRKLTIPPALAYGAAGRPGIPPNSTLVFEVELVSIQ